MIKFDSDNIVIGYIKQLLAEVNLPTCKIYSRNNQRYFEKTHTEPRNVMNGNYYLKDDRIVLYNNRWQSSSILYSPEIDLGNYTRNLIIKNNIYDTYTHTYLGDYLRFLRDYRDINLMPLYNCFTGEIGKNLNIKYNSNTLDFNFNSTDNQYKIYMLPVKLFNKYTIAIESELPVEVCCGLYGKYQIELTYPASQETYAKELYKETYKKFDRLSFNTPVIYDKLENIELKQLEQLYKKEKDLKLFIKLPYNNKSSITILEGSYLNGNDICIKKKANRNVLTCNYGVTNYEHIDDYETFEPITRLQLLKYNSSISYPFADRLIEYLTSNVITEEDENADNVKRLQQVLQENGIRVLNEGLWEDKYRRILYDFMQKYQKGNDKHDCLGYVDKDVEDLYKSTHVSKEIKIIEEDNIKKEKIIYKRSTINTLKDVDIYNYDDIIYQGGNN